MAERSFDDLSTREQIAVLRDAAKELRAAAKHAIDPELFNELADGWEDDAKRIEARDDPFAEEEESPEQLQAEADAIQKIIGLMKQENVKTLGELFERHGVMFEEDLN